MDCRVSIENYRGDLAQPSSLLDSIVPNLSVEEIGKEAEREDC